MRREEIPCIPEYALPSYVRTPEERERFELSRLIAELISAGNEPDGRPNSLFVLYMRKTIYFGDIPTGTPEDWPGKDRLFAVAQCLNV
jgi:hypothetical protein